MSHSPAPWYDDGYRIYAYTDDPDKRNGRVIVEYQPVDGFNQADAPLMTSSPDLLAWVQMADEGSMNPHDYLNNVDFDAARAIIAQADPASSRTRCSCSFSHPAHDWCDGNPDAAPLMGVTP